MRVYLSGEIHASMCQALALIPSTRKKERDIGRDQPDNTSTFLLEVINGM